MKALRVIISGKVQGVHFRENTQAEALKSGTKGWVKNRPDGKVEALIEGDDQSVDDLVNFCRVGPGNAVVKDILIEKSEPKGCKEFYITHD